MTYTTEQLGNALADAALSEWSRVVRDIQPGQPDDREHIERYFTQVRRADGRSWAWFLEDRHPEGLAEYIERTRDGTWESWCGLFVAYCAQNLVGEYIEPNRCVQLTIDPQIAYFVMPSCARLADDDRWTGNGKTAPPLHPSHKHMQRGDIFTVGAGADGAHIGIVDDPPNEAGEFATIEGNSTGRLGDGTRGEGVIRRVRHIREIKQLVRLGSEHYQGAT